MLSGPRSHALRFILLSVILVGAGYGWRHRRPAYAACADELHVTRAASGEVAIAWKPACLLEGIQVWQDTALLWSVDAPVRSPVYLGAPARGLGPVTRHTPRLRVGTTYQVSLELHAPDAMTGIGRQHAFTLGEHVGIPHPGDAEP